MTGVEKLSCKKSFPQSRNRTLWIYATGQQIQSTKTWRMFWLASKTTTVSWCPTRFFDTNTSSRRQPIILKTRSWPYYSPSKNSLSLLTSPQLFTHSFKPWISFMWIFVGQESSDCQFASGIVWQQSRRCGLDSNSYFGCCIDKYVRHMTSPWKTPACTTRTWCAMWSQDCRKSCSRIKPRRKTQQLF